MEFINSERLPLLETKMEAIKKYVSDDIFIKMRLCHFKTGEYLYSEGEAAKYLFILLEGSCKVFKTLENGKSVLLCKYDGIQVLGEVELFIDQSAKSNVQALKNTYCMAISISEYKDLLLEDNKFLRFALGGLCVKLERNNKNMTANLLYTLEQRLAAYILIMNEDGSFSDNYTMLSEYLGCSLRHLFRVLHAMCERRLLKKTKKGYFLSDIPGLEDLAGSIYLQ